MITRKKELFIDYYVKHGRETYGNATKSALEAGYSPKTAYSQGSRLLTQDEVQKAIQRKIEALNKELNLSKDSVLAILWEIARTGKRESDRINASMGIAKIEKWTSEGASQVVSIYEVMKKELDNVPSRGTKEVINKSV